MKSETIGTIVCATVAAIVYLNTIPANFAFDDSFAVIYNGDVTNDANPLRGLLFNDFWGQRISSDQSHKSWRPLTVLSFRLLRQAWAALPAEWRRQVMASRSLTRLPYAEDEAAKRGLDPLLFHVANVIGHSLVSALVCRLSYFLLRRRWRPSRLLLLVRQPAGARRRARQRQRLQLPGQTHGPVRRSPGQADAAASASDGQGQESKGCRIGEGGEPSESPLPSGLRKRVKTQSTTPTSAPPSPPSTASPEPPAPPPPPAGRRRRRRSRAPHDPFDIDGAGSAHRVLLSLDVPAWFSGLAFAVHPVHTEAVAGVVGHAELLCALLSIPAVMLYVRAAERAAARRATGRWTRGSAAAHWAAVAAAALLAVAAALAKEIGITVLGCMLAADVLLVPLVVPWHDGTIAPSAVNRPPPPAGSAARRLVRVAAWALVDEPKWLRMGLVVAVGAAYVRLRSWVAVDQLVRIYRKVENPIAFSASSLERLLSTGHLHARYWGLMMWPNHLSADWSFNCVPTVERPTDPRNALTAALYAYLAWVVLAAAPWRVLGCWWRAAAAATAPPAAEACRTTDHVSANGMSAAAQATAPMAAPAAQAAGEVAAAPRDQGHLGDGDGGGGGGDAEEEVKEAEEEKEDCSCGEEERLWGPRWRLLVLAGLCVGPFFPASNVLFFVGTFIGERLLYFPSIGFCLLVSELLSRALLWGAAENDVAAAASPAAADTVAATHGDVPGAPDGSARQHSGRAPIGDDGADDGDATVAPPARSTDPVQARAVAGRPAASSGAVGGIGVPYRTATTAGAKVVRRTVSVLTYVFTAAVLVTYAVRTWHRNWDWATEETLFEAAGKVCPDSAKVQLNLGIVQRRRGDQRAAIAHFLRARAIEPGYCEPDYWIGISLVNSGQAEAGLAELESALACKYVAAESLKALNTIYNTLHAANPRDPTPVKRWGLVLLRPELEMVGQGCDVLERAALMAAQLGTEKDVDNAVAWCVAALRRPQEGQQRQHHQPKADPTAELHRAAAQRQQLACVEARLTLYREIAAATRPRSQRVVAAVYDYIRRLDTMPYCRLASGPSGEGTAATPPHMHLIHIIQSGDPEDPWLQAEWGRALRAVGRTQEAGVHLSVAAMLLNVELSRLQAGQDPRVGSLAAGGRVLVGSSEALEGIASALEDAAPLRRDQECETWGQALEARRMLAGLTGGAGDARDAARQQAAARAVAAAMRTRRPPCAVPRW